MSNIPGLANVRYATRRRLGRSKWRDEDPPENLQKPLGELVGELAYQAQTGREVRLTVTIHESREKPAKPESPLLEGVRHESD